MENKGYRVGDRLAFIWMQDQSYTPGTIKKISKRNSGLSVRVQWDDGKNTKTSMDWIDENTVRLGVDGRPMKTVQ